MLNKTTMKKLRSEIGIDNMLEILYSTADRIASTRTDLVELNSRVRNKEITLENIELPMLAEASKNGKNETERKATFKSLCNKDAEWQRVNGEHIDAKHHRDLVNATLESYIDRFSAQRHASDLIAATLNASCE